ncbi:MAG: hypothetical protein II453_01510 [Alphaproteobacteria bacterium]|nr:hypothetical protein [Alphaproteobacteria bacterium]
MTVFLANIFEYVTNSLRDGGFSLPVIIALVLSVAFVAMLLVTVFTLLSIKRAEMKARKVIDIPPSAMRDEPKIAIPENMNNSHTLPIGEWLNSYLISKGYIRVNGIVKSFFKALDFLKTSLGTGYKYKLPWYMIIGTENSGKSSLMSGFTHDEIYDDESENPPCTWWFLKNGVVIDIKGALFLPKTGFNADENSWNIVLNMFSRYRSARPLNGIVLTIPADELYGKSKLPIEEIKKRAQYIARKLSFAQNYLGMRLPIYIVVTKTDIVPGFQSFCSEIPVRNRGNMLGWSSPYSVDIPYSPRMLDEGFATFENELNEIRMEIFSSNSISLTRDGIFVFPSELLTIKEALGIYIDAIFKSSSVDEKFFFRGFYFTGDSKMMPLLSFDGDLVQNYAMAIVGTPDADINEVGSISASYNEETVKKIFFFEDLLLKKVFTEEGLASPMKTKVNQANKSILIAKISTATFVVIGSYGLLSTSDKLKESKQVIYPSLYKISSLIKNASDLTYKSLELSGNEILADCSNQLLSMMQQINSAKFSSIFVPASWFSSIHSDLTQTLKSSYQRVVIRTIYMNLMLKARELLTMRADVKSKSIAEVLNPQNSAEYIQMKNYVFGLIELEKNIKKFDSLRISGDPKDLNDLIEYTFKGSLPKEFLDNYQQFRLILMNTPFPAINLSPYKQTAYNVLMNLFQGYLDAIFTTRSESSIISFLNKFILQLSRQNLKEKPNCTEFIKFSKDLTNVCNEIGKEGETWLDKDIFEPDKEFDAFLDGVETLFGKEEAQKILDIVAVNFGYLRAKLNEFNNALKNDISGKKLQNKPENEFPSSGIFLMERCLSVLCAEPFMEAPGDYQLITDIPAGKMIFWDDELVKYAYEIGKSFEQFIATKIKDFPRKMQEGVLLLARSNLCAVIASTVAKAQSLIDEPSGITSEITSEEILQKQVTELKGVAPKLVRLLHILRGDKFSFVFGNLRAILNKIGFSLLGHIDELLENQKPYYPNNMKFDFWDGAPGAGLQAYSSVDSEELELYLQLQRSIITRLALGFADTIVEFLNAETVYDPNYGTHSQLTKWTRIVENVKKIAKKDPTSTVAIAENFIRTTLNSYDLDTITKKIKSKDIHGSSGDYFQNIVQNIKKGLMSRAEVLLRQRNIERYSTLRDYYVKHLENKYPFENYGKSQRTAMDADLDAVREFFAMYDEFGGCPEAILDQIYQLGDDAKEVYEFMQKLHSIRAFFGDSLSDPNGAIKVRLEANFEINKREEKNTDYLVDRVFSPNSDANIEPISSDKSGIWYFGDPIELSLRWAEGDDQADKPVYDQNDPDLILDDKKIRIQCVGNWAAIRFLQKYKAETINSDQLLPNQTVLSFRIPLNSGKIAKIYMGITPSLPKKPGEASVTSVSVPKIPGKMPEMPSAVKSVVDVPVLVNKLSINSTRPKIVKNDGGGTEENVIQENNVERTREDKAKYRKRTRTDEVIQNAQKQEDYRKKAVQILNEPDDVNPDEETLIEVSEEPIE